MRNLRAFMGNPQAPVVKLMTRMSGELMSVPPVSNCAASVSGAVLNENALTSPAVQSCVHWSRLPEHSVVRPPGGAQIWLPDLSTTLGSNDSVHFWFVGMPP